MLLNVQQVAEMVALSTSQVYSLVAKGDFPPPVHIGRSARWATAEIETWVTDRLAERTPNKESSP